MRLPSSFLLAIPFALLAVTPAPDAMACGGCLHDDIQQMENTQVSGHRMIFSISPAQTTLWGQIQYVGAGVVRVNAADQGPGRRRDLVRRALR